MKNTMIIQKKADNNLFKQLFVLTHLIVSPGTHTFDITNFDMNFFDTDGDIEHTWVW